jgi:hypothetical protein
MTNFIKINPRDFLLSILNIDLILYSKIVLWLYHICFSKDNLANESDF